MYELVQCRSDGESGSQFPINALKALLLRPKVVSECLFGDPSRRRIMNALHYRSPYHRHKTTYAKKHTVQYAQSAQIARYVQCV